MKKIILIALFTTLFMNNTTFSQENIDKKQVLCNYDSNNIYETPYSFTKNCPNTKKLIKNTGLFMAGAIGTVGILYIMPETITNWDKNSFNFNNITGKWKHNITTGPVFDNDSWMMNFVAHPYFGAIYYTSARSLGYNAINSALYSAFMSTFIWEYGFEAFAEVPSATDIIVTPILGSILGEIFYLTKRNIIENENMILNSKILGHFITFLIDPINEVMNLITNDKEETDNLFVTFNKKLNLTNNILNKSNYCLSIFYRF